MSRQRVLVLQTCSPAYIKKAMEDILGKGLLGTVHITVFSRALPEELSQFQGVPWIDELYAHHEIRGAVRHLLQFRRDRYDWIVAFFTRDPSYWKIKNFAFLCAGRQILIFNEHMGCFVFTPSAFARFLDARYREWKIRTKQKLGYALGNPQGTMAREPSSLVLRLIRPVHLALKIVIFPARYLYLFVWALAKQHQRRRFLKRHGDTIHFLRSDADPS